MRVNPLYMNDLVGSLDATSASEQQLTEELASGSQVNQLSDNPVAAGENVLLSAQIGSDDTFSQTASSTQSMLQVGDSALSTVVSQLTSAVSLATEANNGTLNASDLESISNQLVGVRDEVMSLANTTYLGQYVFDSAEHSGEPDLFGKRERCAGNAERADRGLFVGDCCPDGGGRRPAVGHGAGICDAAAGSAGQLAFAADLGRELHAE